MPKNDLLSKFIEKVILDGIVKIPLIYVRHMFFRRDIKCKRMFS